VRGALVLGPEPLIGRSASCCAGRARLDTGTDGLRPFTVLEAKPRSMSPP
jgi:hypothetical protein